MPTNENISDNSDTTDEALRRLHQTRSAIRVASKKPITFSSPLLWQKHNPVFFPKTINVIQGKAGSHKSRLTETICAALLKTADSKNDLLGFRTDTEGRCVICYVDTERNLSDQFPYAIQQIKLKAGYTIEDDPADFDYISLLEFPREERFDVLRKYINHVRTRFQKHILIVLDVVPDCIFSFNDAKDSMQLIDLLNQVINQYDVSFLCIIHENPGTEKARGHLGTEIINKASTVIQVSFEKDAANNPTDLLKISYLKCRNSRKHKPFNAEYSETHKGLVLSDPSSIFEMMDSKNQAAMFSELLNLLPVVLTGEISRQQLLDNLSAQLKCSARTILRRLKEIINSKTPILKNGVECILVTRPQDKEILFNLKPLSSRQ